MIEKITYEKNELITEDDIVSLRPGDGISTMKWNEIIGKRVNRDLKGFHKLMWNDLI